MNTIKVGFIGLGGIATRIHIPILAAMPEVVIQAGAEINPSQAERTRQRFRIPKIYDSYQTMLEKETLDAVYVCLPNFLHYEAALAALARGNHVFCEKPVGLSAAHALDLVTKAEQSKLLFMPGYNLRYHEHFRRARELIQQKRIGRILQIQGIVAKGGPYVGWDPKSDWYFNPRSGGLLYDQGSHMLDLMFYLAELDIEAICGTTLTSLPGLPVTDNIAALFRCRSGIIGSMQISWSVPANLVLVLIQGSAGSITVSDSYFEHRTPSAGGSARLGTLFSNMTEILDQTARLILLRQARRSTYADADQNFIEAILGKKPLRTSTRSMVQVHRVLEVLRPYQESDSRAGWQSVTVPGTTVGSESVPA